MVTFFLSLVVGCPWDKFEAFVLALMSESAVQEGPVFGPGLGLQSPDLHSGLDHNGQVLGHEGPVLDGQVLDHDGQVLDHNGQVLGHEGPVLGPGFGHQESSPWCWL